MKIIPFQFKKEMQKKGIQKKRFLKIFLGVFVFGIALSPVHFNFSKPDTSLLHSSEAWAKKKSKEKNKKSAKKSSNKQSARSAHLQRLFPYPANLKPAVEFWKKVYTQYDKNFEIFHDTEKLEVIYSVMDFTELYNNPALDKKARLAILMPRLEEEEARIMAMLQNIHANQNHPERLSKEEQRILNLFADDPNPDKFLEAATPKRIRAQTGIRNKFEEALQISGAYLEEFEKTFAGYNMPKELARLAFVESMFNVKAKSKVGASGVWQFMPGTGKVYGLKINGIVDERNDPYLAAHAAARLLQANYDSLGTWPLALNAYNSGRVTLQNAVAATGTTDIGVIIQNYRGGIYGFASRNFYPSFLAVLEIYENYPKYFNKIKPLPKREYDTYFLQRPVSFIQLSNSSGISWDTLFDYNPQFQDSIYQGRKKIPAGYSIRIPKGAQQAFAEAEKLSADLP